MWAKNIYLNFETALKIWKECQVLSSRNFGSSHSYGCQLQQLKWSIVPSRFKVALKVTLSTPIVDGKHSAFQVFGSSVSYRNVCVVGFGSSESHGQQECQLPLLTGLVALKAIVDRNVSSHCWQDWYLQKAILSTLALDGKHSTFQVFGSPESYSRQELQIPLLAGFW